MEKYRKKITSYVAAVLIICVTTYSLMLPAAALTGSSYEELYQEFIEEEYEEGEYDEEALWWALHDIGEKSGNRRGFWQGIRQGLTGEAGHSWENATASNATASNATASNATASDATPGNAILVATASDSHHFAYEDDDVCIVVTVPFNEILPEDASLSVVPITEDHEDYEILMSGAKDAAPREQTIFLYDINIVDGNGDVIEMSDLDIAVIFKNQKSQAGRKVTILQYDEAKIPEILEEEEVEQDEILQSDGNILLQLLFYIKKLI